MTKDTIGSATPRREWQKPELSRLGGADAGFGLVARTPEGLAKGS